MNEKPAVDKKRLRRRLALVFASDARVEKAVVFGSFLHSDHQRAGGLPKTRSIRELAGIARARGTALTVTEDEIDLPDSIYLPSKYPLASVLPHFMPDQGICGQRLGRAEQVCREVKTVIRRI